jgi:hypothetical protein
MAIECYVFQWSEADERHLTLGTFDSPEVPDVSEEFFFPVEGQVECFKVYYRRWSFHEGKDPRCYLYVLKISSETVLQGAPTPGDVDDADS